VARNEHSSETLRVFLRVRPSKHGMSDVGHFVYQPGGLLRRYVREILWIRSARPRVQVLLPETALTMVLRQLGSASLLNQPLPAAIISGLQLRSRTVEHAADSSIVVVRFTEIGGAAALRDRADLLYNRTLPLEAVFSKQEMEEVQNTLADTPEMRKQAAALERFLRHRIYNQNRSSRLDVSPQIEAAARMIRITHGRHSIATIARRTAMSLSALERQFRATVGASPKQFSRLARLHYVCGLWDTGRSLTEIAAEAGYTDQSHMVRDFQLITDSSPTQFFLTASPRNLPTFYK
jgi:AraC-like DNA-binding protein